MLPRENRSEHMAFWMVVENRRYHSLPFGPSMSEMAMLRQLPGYGWIIQTTPSPE
jgi:hypothetical protein